MYWSIWSSTQDPRQTGQRPRWENRFGWKKTIVCSNPAKKQWKGNLKTLGYLCNFMYLLLNMAKFEIRLLHQRVVVNANLVGGWTNPFQNFARQIASFPPGFGVKIENPPSNTTALQVLLSCWSYVKKHTQHPIPWHIGWLCGHFHIMGLQASNTPDISKVGHSHELKATPRGVANQLKTSQTATAGGFSVEVSSLMVDTTPEN